VAAAKSLALALRVPLAGVNHLRGHAWSPFIALHAEAPEAFDGRLRELLPHLGLIVSGGNTLLFAIDGARKITVLASTRDDAAGEALDKGAKLLGLGYPGGPLIEKFAATGRKDAFDFPRGLGPRSELDFSFSGVKTSLRYLIEKLPPDEVRAKTPDLCASYQQAVIDALVRKTHFAFERGNFKSLGLSGGVANNRTLRAALAAEAKRAGVPLLAAQPQHTGDNAGMIAFAAWADTTGTARDAASALNVEPSVALTGA
jgi:N6-L-threonylcarbamoyladenine synthase